MSSMENQLSHWDKASNRMTDFRSVERKERYTLPTQFLIAIHVLLIVAFLILSFTTTNALYAELYSASQIIMILNLLRMLSLKQNV